MKLADRVREALADAGELEEKRMFGGLCFMVNGKLCIGTKETAIMCRIGPDEYPIALEKSGCRPMWHGSKAMTGYVFVDEEALRTKKDFDYWINASLAYNKIAKAAKSKKKK
jgi:TfoX/Sxy family transcriptional regulator of competence genes